MTTEFLALAQKLADKSEEIIKPYFRKDIGVLDKDDDSPVTLADKNAEAVMREMIEEAFPDHGIFGEEHGVKEGNGSDMWVLDPIDGTRSFICGAPWFGTLIAYVKDGVPVSSVVNIPMMNERWVGSVEGTTYNGGASHVRTGVSLKDASLFTTDIDLFGPSEKEAFGRVKDIAKCVRYGTDCYAYALLASGHIDLVIESGLKPYDAMALIPVIEGAGGIVTGWNGESVDLNWNGKIIAAGSKELHLEAMNILNG